MSTCESWCANHMPRDEYEDLPGWCASESIVIDGACWIDPDPTNDYRPSDPAICIERDEDGGQMRVQVVCDDSLTLDGARRLAHALLELTG